MTNPLVAGVPDNTIHVMHENDEGYLEELALYESKFEVVYDSSTIKVKNIIFFDFDFFVTKTGALLAFTANTIGALSLIGFNYMFWREINKRMTEKFSKKGDTPEE